MTAERSVLTLPLRVGRVDEPVFTARLRTAQRLYNEMLTQYLDRARLMREASEFRQLVGERRTAIAEGRLAGKAPKGYRPTPNARVVAFESVAARGVAWRMLRERFGLYGTTAIASLTPAGRTYYEADKLWIRDLVREQAEREPEVSLGSALIRHSLQRRAWDRVEGWLFAKHGRPRRRSRISPLNSVESSSATSCQAPAPGQPTRDTLRFDPATLQLTWVGAGGKYPVFATAIMDSGDVIARKSLKLRIIQVRIVRKTIHRQPEWFVQLVLDGAPVRKRIGSRDRIVGADLGTQHLAVVGRDARDSDDALIAPLVPQELRVAAVRRRRLQRKMSRSLRQNNPEAVVRDANGSPGGFRRGVKLIKSVGYRDLRDRLVEVSRAEQHARKLAHGRLVNAVLAIGTTIVLEDLSYVAWQRSHGKTTSRTAPGAFVAHLRRRSALYGGEVIDVPAKLKLSQLCTCGAYTPQRAQLSRPIARRASECQHCGRDAAQRDLYSAFLASYVDATKTAVVLPAAQASWEAGADQVLRHAWQQYQAADASSIRGDHGRSKDRSARKCMSARQHGPSEPREVAAPVRETEGVGTVRDDVERFGGLMVTQSRSTSTRSGLARRRRVHPGTPALRAGPPLDKRVAKPVA